MSADQFFINLLDFFANVSWLGMFDLFLTAIFGAATIFLYVFQFSKKNSLESRERAHDRKMNIKREIYLETLSIYHDAMRAIDNTESRDVSNFMRHDRYQAVKSLSRISLIADKKILKKCLSFHEELIELDNAIDGSRSQYLNLLRNHEARRSKVEKVDSSMNDIIIGAEKIKNPHFAAVLTGRLQSDVRLLKKYSNEMPQL